MMKVLIASCAKEWTKTILHHPQAQKYSFKVASHGTECYKLLESFAPDLLILDLMLPESHGIEILQQIRSDPRTKNRGVIITSWYPIIQNYNTAISEGADDFISLPTSLTHFYHILHSYFSAKFKISPFSGIESDSDKKQSPYLPKKYHPNSHIKFWGTRGSTPVAGVEYSRFGGNTVCLEVRSGDDWVIIDSGSGIRALGSLLRDFKGKTIHLFLGHTHWDHIIGFPSFAPSIRKGVEVILYSPAGAEKPVSQLFKEMFSYSFYPIHLEDLQGMFTFKTLHDRETVKVGKIQVEVCHAFHPGPTFCFKIRIGKKSFGYATDNEFLLGYHGDPKSLSKKDSLLAPYRQLISFYEGCDFLIHEAEYMPFEYQTRVGWGHSSVPNAAFLLKTCGIKDWIVTHHCPFHTDEDLQKKTQLHIDTLIDLDFNCRFQMAYDGLVVPL